MQVKWKKSISTKINAGVIGLLLSLICVAFLSFWIITKFNGLSQAISEKHLSELSKSAELHLMIKNVYYKMDKLLHSQSKIGNRVNVKDLLTDMEKLSITVRAMSFDANNDRYLMGLMIDELLPIVNTYSLAVDRNLSLEALLREKIQLLDALYFKEIKKQRYRGGEYNEQLNSLYVLARSLAEQPTHYKFKQATKKIDHLITQLTTEHSADLALFDVINQANDQGIVSILSAQDEIQLKLSVLNTQTDVIIEQLTTMSFDNMTGLNQLVSKNTQKLSHTSTRFITLLIVIVLLAVLFSIALMWLFNRSIAKKLILLANSFTKSDNKAILQQQAQSDSEIGAIAKVMLKQMERNEFQWLEIDAKNKQLMHILDHSQQAIIIYSDDEIVYTNAYCDQILDINDYDKTNIISQSLLLAINSKKADERLQVDDHYFRFFATSVKWNAKQSTLALLIDITESVTKEKILLEALENIGDESVTKKLIDL